MPSHPRALEGDPLCSRGLLEDTVGSDRRFVGRRSSAGGHVAGTATRRHGRCPALRRSRSRRRRVRGTLLAAALVIGLASCTGPAGPGAAGANEAPAAAGTSSTRASPPAVPQAVSRSYQLSEAPHLLDRDAYAFRTLQAVRPGGTYRWRMPGNLYPAAPRAELAVELTVTGDNWWLFEQGVVTQQPSYVREDAGVRVMELDGIALGPCRAQATQADPGPTPDDLARAIVSRYPFRVIQPVTPVSRFGGSGVHLVARLDDPRASLCDNNGLMTYRPMAAQHELVELWIIRVQGERVLVERSSSPDTSARVLSDQQRTLDSLRLVRI